MSKLLVSCFELFNLDLSKVKVPLPITSAVMLIYSFISVVLPFALSTASLSEYISSTLFFIGVGNWDLNVSMYLDLASGVITSNTGSNIPWAPSCKSSVVE